MSSISSAGEAVSTWPHSDQKKIANKQTSRFSKATQTYFAVVAMIVPAALLLVAGVIAGLPPDEGEIVSGVRIGGFEVADVGWAQTEQDLQASLNKYMAEPVVLHIGDQEIEASPEDLGLAIDMEATRLHAQEVGRGSLFDAARERITAKTVGVDVEPVVTYDANQFLATLAAISDKVLVPPTNAHFYYEADMINIAPSEPGVGVDTAAGALALQEAVAHFSHEPVEIPVVRIQPEISSSDLKAVYDDVYRLAGQPIYLYDNGVAWQMNPDELLTIVDIDDRGVSLDMDAIATRIGTLGPTILQLASNATINLNEDGTFGIIPEVISRELDVDASVANLEAALARGEYVVTLAVTEEQPQETTATLYDLKKELNQIASRGMIVGWSDGFYELPRSDWASALRWDVQNDEIGFDRQKLGQILRPAFDQATTPPTGLRWVGGQLITTEDSLPGIGVDVAATVDLVAASAINESAWAELVTVESSDPAIAAGEININTILGYSATYYGGSSANRRTNIEVAASALNGAMIAPRSEFSFNAAIGGTASLDDGYMMGYGIISDANGTPQTVPSVAGGICQVATTVFQAAFWAGMPITNRSWHMYWIPKYGNGPGGLTGLDATVDPDYGLDFNFYNPTDDWLAISAYADGEWIHIELWGSPQGWTIDVGEPNVYNEVKADKETIYRQEDPSMNPGQSLWVEDARDGFSVSIHRVVKNAEGAVIDDNVFESYYLPARNVVLVAPGEAELYEN